MRKGSCGSHCLNLLLVIGFIFLPAVSQARDKKQRKPPPPAAIERFDLQLHFKGPPWCEQMTFDFNQMIMQIRCLVVKT